MIRIAQLREAEQIARIHIDGWRSAYRGIVPDAVLDDLDVGKKTKLWEALLQKADSHTFVFEDDNRITAWISFGRFRDADDKKSGEIWALYVSPSMWRRGYGKELVAFVEDEMALGQVEVMYLWVLEGNRSARTFYEKLGYSIDGRSKEIRFGEEVLFEVLYRKRVEQVAAGNGR